MTALRIDSHQHFWRYRQDDYPWIDERMALLARDYLPETLAPHLQQQSIDATIAVQARAGRAETAFLLELARDNARIAGVVGWEDLAAPQLADNVAQWGDGKLVGWRHQLQDEAEVAAFVGHPGFNRGVAWLQANGYVYDVLVFQRQLADVHDFCARHDGHWLVLDHLGKPALAAFDTDDAVFANWREALRRLAALPHVVCKLSGLVTEADWRRGLQPQDFGHIERCLDTALDLFGARRLMFGTDWPVCLLAASHARVVATLERWSARLSTAEQDAIWGETAIRCYGLRI